MSEVSEAIKVVEGEFNSFKAAVIADLNTLATDVPDSASTIYRISSDLQSLSDALVDLCDILETMDAEQADLESRAAAIEAGLGKAGQGDEAVVVPPI